MQCPACATQNREGRRFCAHCGAVLPSACPECGFVNEPGERFCGGCGQSLGVAALGRDAESSSTRSPPPSVPTSHPPEVLTTPETVEAERRQLTVMFCDLVGSTVLSEHLDPEELHGLLARYQDTCAAVIRRYEGYIARYLGDGLLIYFGFPQAHEDDAERSVRAGLDIVEAMRALDSEISRPGVSLSVRVGIATGLVVAGDIGRGDRREAQAIVGQTANLAARLQSLAEPNTVVIGPATHRLVEGLFDLEDRGPQELKGIAEAVTAYQVRSAIQLTSRFEVSERRGLTPLVGREAEIQLLMDRWGRAKEGESQVAMLSGEAGVGKSRIVHALCERLKSETHHRVQFYGSPYHQNSAFYPAINQLSRMLYSGKDETAASRLNKLEDFLQGLALPAAELAPTLASLLSLPAGERYPASKPDPQHLKQRTLKALSRVIKAMAAQRPVLMVVEDAHWIDPSTLELLSYLIERLRAARFLLLSTYRPEFVAPWGGQAQATLLSLNRLSRRETAALASRVAGDKGLPSEILTQIITRTDGVPLFVEELTKDVLESGVLTQAGGQLVVKDSKAPATIPASLKDSLMARVDRLGPVKELAQFAAAIGRSFSHELLAKASSLVGSELDDAFSRLIESGLVYRRSMYPETRYEFKHALVRDVAYESLLKSTRQHYHHRIAQVLTEHFPEVVDAEPEVLAHHYTEAGVSGQGVEFWHRAAQRALQHSANLEAMAHAEKGLKMLEAWPESDERWRRELQFHLALGLALIVVKTPGAPEVERTYLRARELCQQLSELRELFTVTWGLWSHYAQRGEFKLAKRFADELLALSKDQDDGLRLQAHHAGWSISSALGNLQACLRHSRQGIELYRADKHGSHAFHYGGHDPGACARAHGALALWLSGYPDQAAEQARDAIHVAEQLAHPYSLIHSHTLAAHVFQHRCDAPMVRSHTEAVMSLCAERGITPQYDAVSQVFSGWADFVEGQTEAGIAAMRAGAEAFQRIGAGLRLSCYLCVLAEAYLKSDDAERGLQIIARANEFVQRTGERTWNAEIQRLNGELVLLQSGEAGGKNAEACFGRAIKIAQRQQAKALELRAVTSLGRLWRKYERSSEARDLLAPVYNWFKEGLDTPDLNTARELLIELGQSRQDLLRTIQLH